MYHLDRGNKNGGGVAIYIQNTLIHSIINHMTYAIDDVLECLSVEVLLHNKKLYYHVSTNIQHVLLMSWLVILKNYIETNIVIYTCVVTSTLTF